MQKLDNIPEIKIPMSPGHQIIALSEFIGRHSVALNQPNRTENDYLNSYALPIFDVQSRQPLSLAETRFRRDAMVEEQKYDATTGAYKREELFRQHSQGFSSDETIMAVDIAGLKLLNDFYGGHKTGDVALRSAMSSIQSLPDVKVYRTGGDEFVVVSKGVVTEDDWQKVNESYLDNLKDNSGKLSIKSTDTFLRAGVVKPPDEQKPSDSYRNIDEVVSEADETESKIGLLFKILGNDAGVPKLATSKGLDTWMSENNIVLITEGENIVAYKSWRLGKRRLVPTYVRKRGSVRVEGR